MNGKPPVGKKKKIKQKYRGEKGTTKEKNNDR